MQVNYKLKTGDKVIHNKQVKTVTDTFPSWVRLDDGVFYGYDQLKTDHPEFA